jgi:hypothetical protein
MEGCLDGRGGRPKKVLESRNRYVVFDVLIRNDRTNMEIGHPAGSILFGEQIVFERRSVGT